MAQRVRRRQDDDCAARSADPSLRNHRDRKRELALQAPRLSRCTAPACPGGQTGTSRAALRPTRGGHSAPRGSLLFATGTSLNLRPRGVTIGRRSGVKLQRRLTGSAVNLASNGCITPRPPFGAWNAFEVQLLGDCAGTAPLRKLLKDPPHCPGLGRVDASLTGAGAHDIVTMGLATRDPALERPAELAAPGLLAQIGQIELRH